MFCGYACIVYALRGEFETAAPFIGFAIVLDMLDGRIARLTGTDERVRRASSTRWPTSSRSASRRRSCRSRGGWRRSAGSAGRPASCSSPRRRCAWRASTSRRRRAATSATSSACRARRRPAIPAATVFAYPWGLHDYRAALPALAMVLVPALLMVSTIRFRSFKTIDLQVRRSYTVLIVIAAALVAHRDASAVRAGGDGVRLPRVGVRRHGHRAAAAARRRPSDSHRHRHRSIAHRR